PWVTMRLLLSLSLGACTITSAFCSDVHVWEKVELTFHATNVSANPYANVQVWVDLHGPGFDKRCYGFWDGGDVFRVRVLATQPGLWTWRSGSKQKNSGLNDRTGSFTADPWTESEKAAVETRRGLIRPTSNNRAFEWSDGTPMLL